MKEKSKTILLAEELLYTAFNILKENDNEMPINLLMQEIEKRAQLDDWAKEVYKKVVIQDGIVCFIFSV